MKILTMKKKQTTETHENIKREMQLQIDSINKMTDELKLNLENKEKECQALSSRLEEVEEAQREKKRN